MWLASLFHQLVLNRNEAIQRAKQAEDYLAPYLVRLENPDNIDEVTASWLKDQVMDDFTVSRSSYVRPFYS